MRVVGGVERRSPVICLRCSRCCRDYAVIIVDDPEIGPYDEDNLILHRGGGVPCKHLRGDKVGEYSCSLHDYPWYPETPCARHGQIERSVDTPCRVGKHILEDKQ